jgi:hypothetical protein
VKKSYSQKYTYFFWIFFSFGFSSSVVPSIHPATQKGNNIEHLSSTKEDIGSTS